jgi:hypothetical protein
MRIKSVCSGSLGLLLACTLMTAAAVAQTAPPVPGTPVHMIVTVEGKHGNQPPPVLTKDDVAVYEGKVRDPVVSLIPLQGEHAGLELMILLDDGSGLNLASQLNDIRAFIRSQPPTTAISVGYMRNGTVQFTSNFTNDHEQAAKSLRIPMGERGVNGSPYFSLSDAIKRWPPKPVRQEVLMITDGIDRYGFGTGMEDPYVDQTISDAQRRGIVVFSIYTSGEGHFSHNFWLANLGQNFLAKVSEETGGESFYIGMGNPVSFKPFLDDLSARLNRQYMLTFSARPMNKAQFRNVKLHTELPNTDLAYADRVWVPAGE